MTKTTATAEQVAKFWARGLANSQQARVIRIVGERHGEAARAMSRIEFNDACRAVRLELYPIN